MLGHNDFTLSGSEETRLCVGTDPELWFGPDDDVTPELRESHAERNVRENAAKQLCADCPFTAQCLEQELWHGITEQWGVRGGMTASERQHLLRHRRAADLRPVAAERAVA
ncbi:WhiB family transcriptional regulator [Umezawaea sp. Da 62-37]|uniref:WhiB family transcriptional regulator n=1 Tax=Umezawaea sp. Da 62-37 TaxID=3075927 RepID=UPI0028F6CE7A|nr:WhiB family transcriptional regulator [Umezawaea sp. Da 62-37]WNV83233.1 WhiB family transcriptional regulator [Umezawaea sp. Da 62-37]